MVQQTQQNAEKETRQRIKGVFSTQELRKVGTGTTTRKVIQKSYWFVEEDETGKITVQPLNANYVPSGPVQVIPLEELIARFAPEPEFYIQTVYPRMRELVKTVARADRYRQRGETYSAEYEYSNALKVDIENVRANFGLGLTYLDRGEKSKAEDIFSRLVKLEAAYQPEHKHLFNEFGIKLRKTKMLDEALSYYQRALELSKNDENLYCNLARVYVEKGNNEAAIDALASSLQINPSFDTAVKFLKWLMEKRLVPPARVEQVKKLIAASQSKVAANVTDKRIETPEKASSASETSV